MLSACKRLTHIILSEGTFIFKVQITSLQECYFNKKYKRVGHLFQDRYRSEIVEDDGYVLSLARYIHQNPVKADLVTLPEQYKWSSYNAYMDENNYFSKAVDRDLLLGLFSDDRVKAKDLFAKYMNERNDDEFLDLIEKEESMDESEAKEVYRKLLEKSGIVLEENIKNEIPEEVIRELKSITKLSIRRIAEITKINKDKINKILNSDRR